MLGERTRYATGVADVYTFMTTLIRSLSLGNPFQVNLLYFPSYGPFPDLVRVLVLRLNHSKGFGAVLVNVWWLN